MKNSINVDVEALQNKKKITYGQLSFFSAKIAIIYSSISLNMCFERSKERSHWDGSFEYP